MTALRPCTLWAALVAASSMLAGCATSPEPQQYTLRESVAPVIEPTHTLAVHHIVRVRRAVLPTGLDRPQLVWSTADHRVLVDEFHRWSSSLGDEVTTAVTTALQRAMPQGWVVTADDAGAAEGDVILQLEILQFDLSRDGQTTLDVMWRITTSSSRVSLAGRTRRSDRREGAGTGDVIEAQARAISAVGGEIANALDSLADPGNESLRPAAQPHGDGSPRYRPLPSIHGR